MDAIKLIKDDHRKVEGLFAEFEALGARAQKSKQRLADQIIQELKLHAHIEETVFYPALLKKAEEDEIVFEGYEEHEVMKFVISEIEEIDASHERFDVRVKVLKEVVQHHIQEEEKEMLPEARKVLGAALLKQLGMQMAEAKQAGLPGANVRVTMVRETPVSQRTGRR
jgi:hemerythrin superfamily protein